MTSSVSAALLTFLLFPNDFLSAATFIRLQMFVTQLVWHVNWSTAVVDCGFTPLGFDPLEVFWLKLKWQRPRLTTCPQGDSLRTSIQLDFGDGIKITYSNLSRTDDGIKHVYRTTGIYRVMATAENSQGSVSSTLFLHITSMWIGNRTCSSSQNKLFHE